MTRSNNNLNEPNEGQNDEDNLQQNNERNEEEMQLEEIESQDDHDDEDDDDNDDDDEEQEDVEEQGERQRNEEPEPELSHHWAIELLRRFNLLETRTVESRRRPRTWKDVHSIQSLQWNGYSLTEELQQITTILPPNEIVLLAEKLVPLSFLTFASGETRQITIFHTVSFFSHNPTQYIALTGLATRSFPMKLRIDRLFATRSQRVPTLKHLSGLSEPNDSPTTKFEKKKLCNTIALPPFVAKYIMSLQSTDPELIYRRLLQCVTNKDRRAFNESSRTGEMTTADMTYTAHLLPTLQHLYHYANARTAKPQGMSFSDDDRVNEWSSNLDTALRNGTLHEQFDRPDNTPRVSFDDEDEIIPDTRRDNNNNNEQQRERERRRPTHFTFTGGPDSNTRNSTGSQTPPNQPRNNTNQSNLHDALQNLTHQQSLFTSSVERFVNTTADTYNEKGERKIGQIVKQVICNASTADGENPADELTPFAKDLLTAKGDEALIHLKILFEQNGVRACPTPKFIAAARKGNLTYDGGIPDGLSITQLPQTLQGTDLERLDIARLLNMEENGTITEQDTLALNKNILPISRTLHYLQDKAHAWFIFCKHYYGDLKYLSREAEAWYEWIKENFNALQDTRATCDRDFPAKIELSISNNFNQIHRTAMIGVPDESIFQDQLREQILKNTAYLAIPHAVKEILDGGSSKRQAEGTQSGSKKRAKTTITKITHENQPRDLLLSTEQYRAKITPFVQANKDKIPKFDNSTDECLKFAFLGYCNSECPRKKAHSKISKGTRRFDQLNKLKNEAMNSNSNRTNSNNQDFQQGD